MDVQYVLTIVNIICTVVIACFGFFVRRVVNNYDDLEKEVIFIRRKVEILLDRDRRKRVADYESEDAWPGKQGRD